MPTIRPAALADAGEVLTVQRAAFVTEAQLHDDASMPPLMQTLDEVRAAIAADTVLVAVDGTRIVGSVRAEVRVAEWYIGRLVIVPDRQGEGIGSQLLQAIEALAPPTARVFTLTTGPKSDRNIALYERHGYHRVPADGILIHLSKAIPAKPSRQGRTS